MWYYQFTKGKVTQWSVDLMKGLNLKHPVKVVERIFECRIRQQIEINDLQFRFMKGKVTTDAIFLCKTVAGEF